MTAPTKTDREMSLAADEFVWDTDSLTDVHRFVGDPILKLLAQHKAKTVLDIGCGNGAFTSHIAGNGYTVVGTEYSRSGIEIAQKNYPNATFQHYDVNDPLPQEHAGRYDAVISVEVIEHLLLPRKLIENGTAALKPGGILILTTPFHGYWKNLALALTGKFDDHWHPLRDFGHVKFFSKATITRLLDEYHLRDVTVTTVGRIPAFARSMIVSGVKQS